MKKTLALLLAVLMLVGFLPVTAKADNTGVTVWVSVSDDAGYVNEAYVNPNNPSDYVNPTVMALKQINVPYFDIGVYGLADFYYNEHCYDVHDFNPSNQIPGTQSTAQGHVTLLHVMIYALEVFYFGNSSSNVGHPTLHSDLSSVLAVSGTPGSIYFTNYWGKNYNLQYFVNYSCPVAYDHWGATADQYEVPNNSIVSIGHFSDYSFYMDSNGIFSYAKPTGTTDIVATTSPVSGSVSLTFYHAFANLMMNDTTTSQTPYGGGVPVCYCNVSALNSGAIFDEDLWSAVSPWTYIGDTDSNGAITINTSGWGTGTYIVAIPGQPGAQAPYNTCSTPGGILVIVG